MNQGQVRAVRRAALDIMNLVCLEEDFPPRLWERLFPHFSRLLRLAQGTEQGSVVEAQWSEERKSLLERNAELLTKVKAREFDIRELKTELLHAQRVAASRTEDLKAAPADALFDEPSKACEPEVVTSPAAAPEPNWRSRLSRCVDAAGPQRVGLALGLPMAAVARLVSGESSVSGTNKDRIEKLERELELEGKLIA